MPSARPSIALLSVASNLERHKLASDQPFLLLLDIEYPGDASPIQPLPLPLPGSGPSRLPRGLTSQQHVRLVRNPDPVTFDAGDGLGPQLYQPFNFEMGEFKTGIDGSVPSLELKASNVLRALQGVIEQYAGVVGANLYLYAVNTANPAGEPDLALAFTITGTSSDSKQVTFKLGASSPLRRLFPIFMYRPNSCMWQYNAPALQVATAAALAAGTPLKDPPGAQCGYLGSLPTCSKTLDGVNGCKAHGNVVRFGGFPGIDTQGGAAATVA